MRAAAPTTSSASAKAMWCAPPAGSRSWPRSATSWSRRSGDIPIRVKDVAEVTIGRDLRTGSASMNGREAVLGTVLMLVGGNSRTVAAAATPRSTRSTGRCRRASAPGPS